MATALPRNEFFPLTGPGNFDPDDPHGATRETLIEALGHPNPDVRLLAAARMCGCLIPRYAVLLATWLLKEKQETGHLARLVVDGIYELPDSAGRTTALLVLARHPSKTVQHFLAGCLSMPARNFAGKNCHF